MTTLERLCSNVKDRQKFLLSLKGEPDKRNKVWRLYDKDPELLISMTYGAVLMSIERKAVLTAMIRSLGSIINRRFKLKEDEITEAHLGWFVLIAYLDTGILKVYSKHQKVNGKRSKFPTYHVRVLDTESLNSVMELIDPEVVELFPAKQPPKDWGEGFLHEELGFPLIKHAHKDAIAAAKVNDMSYIKETINKLQRTGWRINVPVYNALEACVNSPETPFKFNTEVDPEKKASLIIEIEAIRRLAKRNLNNAFYHLYNLDFRGRIYPNTAFLHEQSSDNAKGILMFDEPVPLGDNGSYWLSVHTANMWGNDKVSLDDRAQWTADNLDDILLYTEDPMKHTGWMQADKPFCFLACCYEWSQLSNWHGDGYATEEFPSCLPLYIDGSNNGVQHLVAMSKDEEIAPLVNLVPQELPGDVYMFIAEHVKANVERDAIDLDEKYKSRFDEIYSQLVELRQAVGCCIQGSEIYKQSLKRLKEFSNSVYDIKKKLGPIFWSKIEDKKIWRKTVKRPVMTLGYGGTKYGMVDMVDGDTRDISEYLRDKDKAWSAYLGHLIYDTCYAELKGPAKLLKMFEELAIQENNKDRPIAFTQIVTGFPFVHSYREPQSKQTLLSYGEETLKITVQLWKESTLKKSKQKSGAAPNIVHSLDAVHLSMYIHDTDYPVTVVHDSFGCHAGNMEKAFVDVRKKFLELYEKEPLEYILAQMDALDLIPEKGTLDVREILTSDYAFA